MAKSNWKQGAVIRKSFGDGWTYYGRLLDFPWAAFYRLRTETPSDDLDAITASPVLFVVAAHKDLIGRTEWRSVGLRPLEPLLRPPAEQAIWDDDGTCQIIDTQDNMRPGTREECERLEVAAVWEPEHIGDRLQDTFAGRENRWLREMRPDLD